MSVRNNTIESVDTNQMVNCRVILDLDGTLVPDKQDKVSDVVVSFVKKLTQSNKVYICSNGESKRTKRMAELFSVPVLEIHKPWGPIHEGFLRKDIKTVVVGDKYLTDGFFAKRIGAIFVKTDHLRASSDTSFIKISYLIDDVFWFTKLCLKVIRPFQWIKNILVFAPLFFAGGFLTAKVFDVALAFAGFSIAASLVYVFNDIVDRDYDSLHPTKRFRPFASGNLSLFEGCMLMGILVVFLGIVFYQLPSLILPVFVYVLLNVFYSLWFKHKAVVDVLLVSSFYIIRIVVGGIVARVPLSPWILLCVFFGALFIILGKRKAEYGREVRREVLKEYSEKALDYMFIVSAALAIITYSIYTVIGHSSDYLVYSTFFILLALFRVLNRMYTHPEEAESPEVLVFKDKLVLGAFVGWLVYVFYFFY